MHNATLCTFFSFSKIKLVFKVILTYTDFLLKNTAIKFFHLPLIYLTKLLSHAEKPGSNYRQRNSFVVYLF